MSAYHDIFLRPAVADADLLRDLEAALGSRPVRHTDGGEGYVVGYDGAWIDVYLAHDLEDNLGMPFSRYPYYLTVRAPGLDREGSVAIARRLYWSLANSGRYDGFIVWNDAVLVSPTPEG